MEKIVYTECHVAGSVILYNSSIRTIENINTYINQVNKLYVIDNSTEANDELIKALIGDPKIDYYPLNGNKGIATALNYAAHKAISDGYTLLLTMDDDTCTPSNMISQMINFWNQFSKPIGILSGVHHMKEDNAVYRKIPYTLTSGNLLNLSAFKITGDFCDALFIDHVDHEYGLRLNRNEYLVIELPSIKLKHRLGTQQTLKVGPFILGKYGNHSPIRYYYFTRNGIYLIKKYPNKFKHVFLMVTKELIKRVCKACLFDSEPKLRLKFVYRGMLDGIASKLGPYSNKDEV